MYSTPVTDINGNTLLHTAILSQDINRAKMILDIIIRSGKLNLLNAQNKDGDTPLHLSVRNFPLSEFSNTLIELGAKTNIKNKKGETIGIALTLDEYYAKSKSDPVDNVYLETITILDLKDSQPDSNTESMQFPTSVDITSYKPNLSNSESTQFPTDVELTEYKPNLVTEENISESNLQKLSNLFKKFM